MHGVRLQPGKPTAFGDVAGRPVICLPGYPVAALSNLYLFIRPAIKRMAHLDDEPQRVQARVVRKMTSKPGYLSLVRVASRGWPGRADHGLRGGDTELRGPAAVLWLCPKRWMYSRRGVWWRLCSTRSGRKRNRSASLCSEQQFSDCRLQK